LDPTAGAPAERASLAAATRRGARGPAVAPIVATTNANIAGSSNRIAITITLDEPVLFRPRASLADTSSKRGVRALRRRVATGNALAQMIPAAAEVSRLLPELFDAERSVRRLHAQLAKVDPVTLLGAVAQEVAAAIVQEDEDEAALRLVRMAALLGELEGPKAVDLLIDILGCEEPEARHAAGEALEELAFDRFKEVALGVERALERLPASNPALTELPFLLAEIPEPGVRKLLGRFLAHKSADAVAAGIEALVEVGDPAAAGMLLPLEADKRDVVLEDDEGEEGSVTIGELATEARKMLTALPAGGRAGDL
jgi:hypothetical protein